LQILRPSINQIYQNRKITKQKKRKIETAKIQEIIKHINFSKMT
jgi:hypothetical protein